MGIKNIFIWYQQKIGTYDKQKWETKIEQREQRMYGLTHIQMRSTKPNTDLIDLDLVRGSSFTKAKPQHGFIKVVKLATLRSIFYPFYGKWWIEQTSIYVFLVTLVVYILEIINMVIYSTQIPSINNTGSEHLSSMELFVPFLMMWVLSLIHSQIVATSSGLDHKKTKVKQKQFKRKRSNIKKFRKIEENVCSLKNFTNNEHKDDMFTTSVINKKWESDCKRFSALGQCIKDLCNKDLERVDTHASEIIDGEDFRNNTNIKHDKQTTDKLTRTTFVTMQEKKEPSTNIIYKQDIGGTDSESEIESVIKRNKKTTLINRRNKHLPSINITSVVDSPYDSEDDILSSPENRAHGPLIDDISATEWMSVTTNSEDCSYSSDIENISESNLDAHDTSYMGFDSDLAPTAILNPPSLKVSCVIWERNEIKKADLSMLNISSTIIGKVDLMPESMDYFYIGIVVSTILAFLPFMCRVCNISTDGIFSETRQILTELYRNATIIITTSSDQHFMLKIYKDVIIQVPLTLARTLYSTVYINKWELSIMVIAFLQRWILSCMVFFLLCVAERTFKQRLLYAKLFSHLTSSRRARKSELPHFRLNKDTVLFSQYYLEALIWCLGLGTLLLRFMTLGTKINKKYRNLSVLITEQINLHLQIEQKPHKKDEYTVANNVLKLAIDLLKELENPFKISGLSANPILYNVTKLVILSALSGVLSEMLGFKLKLHKIKLK